jgi:hypothetical protein
MQQIQQTVQRVDIFDLAFTKRAHTFSCLKSSTNILRTASLLIPIFFYNIQTQKFPSPAKHFE